MRATVDIGEEDTTESYEVSTGGWFKKKEIVTYHPHYHTVTVLLELTEEERATIQKYDLQKQVLEDRPRWTADEVAEARQRHIDSNQENLNSRNVTLKAIAEQGVEDADESMRNQRDRTTVADLLAQPCVVRYGKPLQAANYADRLKTKILPALSELLKKHATAPKSETLEF
jgi:hypothetical protein